MQLKDTSRFPEGFLWGAATSSFQAEGAWTEGGKGESVIGLTKTEMNTTDFTEAVDHYHRFREDIALMAELGLKAYRLSISWTRIFPQGAGKPNQEGVAFYRAVLDELAKYGIEPVVTIYHFDYPKALVEKYGGWLSRSSIDDFTAYAEFLFKTYGDQVRYWLIINEQDHVIRMPYRLGLVDPDKKSFDRTAYQANHHMCVASAKAIESCRRLLPNAKIGPATSYDFTHPASGAPEDALAAEDAMILTKDYLMDIQCRGAYSAPFLKYLRDRDCIPDIAPGDMETIKANPPDFIAMNYYASHTVEFFPATTEEPIGTKYGKLLPTAEAGIYRVVKNERLERTDWGWEVDPIGFRMALKRLYDKYGLPLLVTENGFGAKDALTDDGKIHDDYRIAYLRDHIEQLRQVVGEGIPVFGYCVWSFMDVISGHSGMDKRYGLVYVNRENFDLKDMRRIKKDSFEWYRMLIATNGLIEEER